MQKVVIDTNVIISALLSEGGNPAFILSLVLQKQIKLCLSESIFEEYQTVLARKKFIKLKGVDSLLSRLKEDALLVKPTIKLNASPDKSDNKFFECAVQSKADFLVTGNIKDFPQAPLKKTRILTPTDYIYFNFL